MVDADVDTLSLSPFMVLEIEELMNMGEQLLLPVLTYLFHRIEKNLKGQPTLLILDEAWIMLGHPVFRAKIREWLKVLRKANCAVVLATQTLSDAGKSGILDVLVESCLTKILLANSGAYHQREIYADIGLNDQMIDILANAAPKRDYYIMTPAGRRLVNLSLGPRTLAFIGRSDKESLARIRHLSELHGKGEWYSHWLEECGCGLSA
jgi:type IV secretion system protein VirB4